MPYRVIGLGEEFVHFLLYRQKGRISDRELKVLRWHVAKSHSGSEYNLWVNECYGVQLGVLNDELIDTGLAIDDEKVNAGIAWLWANRKLLPGLGQREISILRQVQTIRLCGVALHTNGVSSAQTAPIWRVISMAGDKFEYEAWSWQSGRKPRIVG